MKVISSVSYTQSIMAPKGFVFDLDKVNNSCLFNLEEMLDHHKPTLGLEGRVLEWKEPWNISGEIKDESFWNEHLTPCLIKVKE